MNFVSIDAGGTKLNAIWFDENLNLLGTARARGINRTISTHEDILEQIKSGYDLLFGGNQPRTIDCLYLCGFGSRDFVDCLQPDTEVLDVSSEIGETRGGLLAGRGLEKGIVVVAGTGSDALYYGNGRHDAVGGVGAILGDQGSGVWMARQAVQGAVKYASGWGEETLLAKMIVERLGIRDCLQSLVNYIYATPAPFQRLGSLLPMVAEAAKMGDKLCYDVFVRGGDALAKQTLVLIDRHPDFGNQVLTCGGAWKAHPVMFETFKKGIQEKHPETEVHRPWFEHVIAGPMRYLLDKGYTPVEAKEKLLAAFPAYEWRM